MRLFFSASWRKYFGIFLFLSGIGMAIIFSWVLTTTSTNTFCDSCHVHPQATISWRQGSHYDNKTGVIVNCVDCHLPPAGIDYLQAKAYTGLRDVWATLFTNTDQIDWEQKSSRASAVNHVYKAGCINCHQNLFPRTLSKKGEAAHLYYDQQPDDLRCINCHLEVGHFHKKSIESPLTTAKEKVEVIYTRAAKVDSFVNYTETVPGTSVSFDMIAIPGGSFLMGSRPSESYREEDEGPQNTVEISPFWIEMNEVTWDEYEAFIKDTRTEGRTEDQVQFVKTTIMVDAMSGPTPAYGNPDQGWGKNQRPAITMTHYAATKYCEWLSAQTGKHYRLPTEAEWEYSARARSEGPYFFQGDPETFSSERLWNKFFGIDTSLINPYVVYLANSRAKTQPPQNIKANPFGLLHMLGNVKEFCSDWYAIDTYQMAARQQVRRDPQGPESGKEHVIRGGSYLSDASQIRLADRDQTRQLAWLRTDPQLPKSLWWYSDNNEVGFRVVCDHTD
jgi:formylglycine-generating enzyme required for sulfatase activity/nitrate/TMAO reductase-like tetraheme cytochrome c subunit